MEYSLHAKHTAMTTNYWLEKSKEKIKLKEYLSMILQRLIMPWTWQQGELLEQITQHASVNNKTFHPQRPSSAGTIWYSCRRPTWLQRLVAHWCMYITGFSQNVHPHLSIPLPSSPELLQCSPAYRVHTGHRSHKGVSGWAWIPPSGWWNTARVLPNQAWSGQLHVRGTIHEIGMNGACRQCNYSVCEMTRW